MQFLVSVEEAKALMKEDEDRILREVREGVGYDYVNRVVRGAICGALVSSRCSVVRKASVGNASNLIAMLEECYRKYKILERKGPPSSEMLTRVHGALCAAAASGFCDIFDLILEYNEGSGVSLMSMFDPDGMSVLMHAVRSGHIILVERILAMCTTEDLDAINNDRWTALAFAAQLGCEKILSLLLTKTNNVNLVLSGGQIAIGIGCQNNFSLKCCEILLNAGSNVHHRDEVGYTVLKHALVPGFNQQLVRAILNANADPNAVDNWGEPILIWSIQAMNIESVKTLLEYVPLHTKPDSDYPVFTRVDVNQVNVNSGMNALDRAIEAGKDNAVDLLKSFGALTIQEVMKNNGNMGCGHLLESNIAAVMNHFHVDREHAGLMLSVKAGRIDWTLESSSFPNPFDVVSVNPRQWGYGIVTRGPDWDYPDTIDGGPGCIGYIQALNQSDVKEGKVRVKWPLSDRKEEGYVFQHRAGAEGKFDLYYAPYICAPL